MTAENTADVAEQPHLGAAATEEIATLPPNSSPTSSVGLAPRTGEPRRSWLIRLATISCGLAAVAASASLLWSYWIAVTDYFHASWLTAQFGDLLKVYVVLLVVGLTAAALLVVISNVITGYYSWFGYRWARVAGIVSSALSPLTLLINPIGWFAIGFALVGAGLLWLPAAKRFFAAWQDHRHPQTEFAAPIGSVFYGPLPRYHHS